MQLADRERREGVKDSAVVFRQLQEISNSNGYLRPIECSAKNGENVERIFMNIAHALVKLKRNKPPVESPRVVESSQRCTSCL